MTPDHLTTVAPADAPPDTASTTVDQRAVRAVLRLSRHLSHILAGVELTAAQYRVLAFLAEGDAMASEMAGRMAVSKPSVTTLVDGLVDRGLVVRHADPVDRRRRNLCITPDGLRALAAADDATAAHLGVIAGAFDDPAAAIDDLARWDDAVRRHRDRRLAEGSDA